MKQDELDDLLKKELAPDFEEQIPEHFISDLNARLDQLEKKKKIRLFFLWFVSFAFIASATTFGYFEIAKKSKKNIIENIKINLPTKNVSLTKNNERQQHSRTKLESEKVQLLSERSGNVSKKSEMQSKTSNFWNGNSYPKRKSVETYLITDDKIDQINSNKENTERHSSQMIELTENVKDTSNMDISKSEETKLEKIKDSAIVVNKTEIPKIKENDKPFKIQSYSIGLFAGVSGIFSSINTNDNLQTTFNPSALKTYRETRRQQERVTSSWDLALRIQMNHEKMTFQSGIEYFEWGEQLVYDYNSITGINRYSYINIPFNVGFLLEKGKIGVNPFVGISVGYGFRRDGSYLNPDLSSVSIITSERFISTFHAGGRLTYKLEQYSVSIMPVYRMSLGPVVNQGVVRNSYKSIGLQMGLSYRF